eukprot:COSAG06_NODE_11102_length_1566_cov_6.520120_3_plen_102_part_00
MQDGTPERSSVRVGQRRSCATGAGQCSSRQTHRRESPHKLFLILRDGHLDTRQPVVDFAFMPRMSLIELLEQQLELLKICARTTACTHIANRRKGGAVVAD